VLFYYFKVSCKKRSRPTSSGYSSPTSNRGCDRHPKVLATPASHRIPPKETGVHHFHSVGDPNEVGATTFLQNAAADESFGGCDRSSKILESSTG